MSRFLLVVLEEDLAAHYTTRTGVWASLKQVSGIQSITDLSAISQTTLDLVLLKPTEALKKEEPTTYNAIRQYHARKRQPRLLP